MTEETVAIETKEEELKKSLEDAKRRLKKAKEAFKLRRSNLELARFAAQKPMTEDQMKKLQAGLDAAEDKVRSIKAEIESLNAALREVRNNWFRRMSRKIFNKQNVKYGTVTVAAATVTAAGFFVKDYIKKNGAEEADTVNS
jgi:phage shock protein A